MRGGRGRGADLPFAAVTDENEMSKKYVNRTVLCCIRLVGSPTILKVRGIYELITESNNTSSLLFPRIGTDHLGQ